MASHLPRKLLSHCLHTGFKATGSIRFEGGTLGYTYNINSDNRNSVTVKSMSTTLSTSSPILKRYEDYYGRSDYGNIWIRSAMQGGRTELTRGLADFGGLSMQSRASESLYLYGSTFLAEELLCSKHSSFRRCICGNDCFDCLE